MFLVVAKSTITKTDKLHILAIEISIDHSDNVKSESWDRKKLSLMQESYI